MNTVLAAQTGPRGGAAGTGALPNTGHGGGERAGTGRLVAMLAFAAGGVGLIGIMTLKRRRR